jgi:hypothetical protein
MPADYELTSSLNVQVPSHGGYRAMSLLVDTEVSRSAGFRIAPCFSPSSRGASHGGRAQRDINISFRPGREGVSAFGADRVAAYKVETL